MITATALLVPDLGSAAPGPLCPPRPKAYLWPTDLESGRWLWNSVEYPYKGRTVRALFAAGNGGQIVMGIPELDLVIAFTGGNYNDRAASIPGRVFVQERILPAVN